VIIEWFILVGSTRGHEQKFDVTLLSCGHYNVCSMCRIQIQN
jgi:hypothetical protein